MAEFCEQSSARLGEPQYATTTPLSRVDKPSRQGEKGRLTHLLLRQVSSKPKASQIGAIFEAFNAGGSEATSPRIEREFAFPPPRAAYPLRQNDPGVHFAPLPM